MEERKENGGRRGGGLLLCSWLKSPVLVPGIMDQVEHTEFGKGSRERTGKTM